MAITDYQPRTVRGRIGPRSAGRLMTPEEFDSTPESAWARHFRYELINGVLVVTPPAGIGERGPNDYLGYLLLSYQEGHPRGGALDATAPEQTVATTENRRRADRALWAGLGRLPDTEKDVPTIVVEFVSVRRRDALRDYEQKRDEYLAVGVREYWIIDRFRRIMTVYRKGPFGPVHQIVPEGQNFETDFLPGFVLPIARLLGMADRWKKARPKRPRKPPAGGTDG
jgi:Uma2 family endonuclease